MMPCKDLRVVKTEHNIEQAFLQLLTKKPYRAVTVQDILDIAGINRSTFYRHYASKDALAEAMVANFRTVYECFLSERFKLSDDNLADFLDNFLRFIYTEKNRILALWQIKTEHIHLYDDMYHMIKSEYINCATHHNVAGNLDYQGHAYASFILSNIDYTLHHNEFMNIEQMRDELAIMMATARIQIP